MFTLFVSGDVRVYDYFQLGSAILLCLSHVLQKEEEIAKTNEIFGKRCKESRKYISPSTGKKWMIKQEKEQFYPVKRANL